MIVCYRKSMKKKDIQDPLCGLWESVKETVTEEIRDVEMERYPD